MYIRTRNGILLLSCMFVLEMGTSRAASKPARAGPGLKIQARGRTGRNGPKKFYLIVLYKAKNSNFVNVLQILLKIS